MADTRLTLRRDSERLVLPLIHRLHPGGVVWAVGLDKGDVREQMPSQRTVPVHKAGGTSATSPARRICGGLSLTCTMPVPGVATSTCRVLCVCQLVRAPGVKVTRV